MEYDTRHLIAYALVVLIVLGGLVALWAVRRNTHAALVKRERKREKYRRG